MKPNYLKNLWLAASVTIGAMAAVACDDTGLYPAGYPNIVDTTTIYALRMTPIGTPSAFDISIGLPVRTDQGAAFDFAFDIDSLGVAVIFPAGALGLGAEAGLQLTDKEFDELDEAPYDKYVTDSVIAVAVDDVFIGRSRNTSGLDGCYYYGQLPRYGKFHVIELDMQERTLTLEILVNVNCGYRKLEPGYPNY